MAYESGPVTLGTGDTDIFVCPAAQDAAVKVTVANLNAATRALTLKHYRAFNATTVTICSGTVIAALAFPALSFAITLKAGDKIIGSASATSSLVATPAISLTPSSAAKGFIPRGAYAAGTTYAKNDSVDDAAGNSYLSMVDGNIGNTPVPGGSTAYWQVNSLRGLQGVAGVAGASALTVVRVAAVGVIDYATELENLDTIDGVVLATNDLVLLVSSSAPARTGVYVVQASGPALRHSDFDTYDEHAGRFISVRAGTLYHDTLWVFSSDVGGTLNTTAIVAEKYFPAVKGHIFGLTLSNNGSDATNDIDIAVGEAVSTETSPGLMILAAALTKRLDAAWVVGTNQGGLDTGAIANGTYHVWLIQRSDTGVVDVLFSVSVSAPTMPANYDRKRRIGSIIRASAAILAFRQTGDVFKYVTPVVDRDSTSAVADALLAISVPAGIRVLAIQSVYHLQGTVGDTRVHLGDGDAAACAHIVARTTTSGMFAMNTTTAFVSNTASQIRFASVISSGTIGGSTLYTDGWIDDRGRTF